MEKQLEASIHTAIAFMEERGFRYALIGGIALAQWGVVRATYDVDFKVLVPNNEYFVVRDALRTAFPERARPEVPQNPLIVDVIVGGIVVDFLLALPGYEEQIVERAVQRDLNGWSALVCSAEDLIIQKVVAGRDKDWLDVEALLFEQHQAFDQAYVDNWLMEFAEALDNGDLLTRYKRLLERKTFTNTARWR